jgi:hypothetical protein
MQHSIQSQIVKGQSIELVELFGYTTKGIPGLEIIGLGAASRQIKEKLIFIARSRNYKLNHRRFVLCLESYELSSSAMKYESVQWLELPLFVLTMTLAGIFPFFQLSNSFCAGRIDLNGEIEDWKYSQSFLEAHKDEMKKSIILMNDQSLSVNKPVILLNEFYSASPDLSTHVS